MRSHVSAALKAIALRCGRTIACGTVLQLIAALSCERLSGHLPILGIANFATYTQEFWIGYPTFIASFFTI